MWLDRLRLIAAFVFLIGGYAVIFGNPFGPNHANGQALDTEAEEWTEIINEIRSILEQVLIEYQNENFSGASTLVDEAYLENYELIKGALAEQDMSLMEDVDVQLRGQLRDQVDGTDPDADVPRIITELNFNLDKIEALLANISEN